MPSFLTVCSRVVLAVAVLGLVAAQDGTKASIGEQVPGFTFRELIGGDGRQKLSEFRGQPVLIVNWTDTDFGRGGAQMAQKLGADLVPKGLVLILLDTHNKKREQIEASVLRLFPGSLSLLTRTQKPPIAYLDNGPPPDVALIGVDGTLLVAGSHATDFGRAAKQAKAEIKRLKSGWGEHKQAKKARALAFGKGDLAGAWALLEAAMQADQDQPELLAAQAEFTARQMSWTNSVQHLRDAGEPLRARESARALAKSVAGHAEWAAQAEELLETFETDEAKSELELDEALAAIVKGWRKKAPRKADVKKLEGLAESHGETKVGARAAHLAKIAALALGS